MRFLLCLLPICLWLGCSSTPGPDSASRNAAPEPNRPTLVELAKRAERFQSALALPQLETSSNAVHETVDQAIADGNLALDAIGRRPAGEATFENTIRALDDLGYQADLAGSRVYLLKETSTNAAVREAASEAIKRFEEWTVSLDYREDVYRAVTAFAATQLALDGESKKFLEEILRDYRRAGLHLPKPERDEVERLRKELARLSTDFDAAITKAQRAVRFTRAELEGVPDRLLNAPGVKTGDDEFAIQANVTWQYQAVTENARHEETRRRLYLARNTLAKEENVPRLKEILALRHAIARKLGYASWADYRTEPKMAKTADTARQFLENLRQGLQPKFAGELEVFRQLKVRDTKDAQAQVRVWDVAYYSSLLKKEQYTVDAEKLRAYFPYDKVLSGMFAVYERIFGLRITPLPVARPWVEGLELYAVTDSVTAEPLGLFYLDMFPREGKYNHFAQFPIISGKRLASGMYQRPTVALICNFPTPQPGQPSLLSHDEVETLFHEFGHALHSIVTRANFARFSGTSVPRDFVEAPSQMLENWVWDKTILDTFAAHYQNPAEKIPQSILDQLKAARLATIGSFTRRQLALGLVDLTLHDAQAAESDPVALSNRILGEVVLPVPEEAAFVAYFGHLTGYDAGYYGYAWAEAIAADMATVFEQAPDRFQDVNAGRRLRREIYEPGDSRDVSISIEKFLGRPRSLKPYLKTLGLESTEAGR